jgi:hypothetical protein
MLGEEFALKQAIVSNFTYGGQLEDFEAMMEVFIGGLLTSLPLNLQSHCT